MRQSIEKPRLFEEKSELHAVSTGIHQNSTTLASTTHEVIRP